VVAVSFSFSTAAPPGWHYSSGLEIPFPYKPPAPQEEVIKRGLLFANLDRVFIARVKQREEKTELEDGELEDPGEKEEEEEAVPKKVERLPSADSQSKTGTDLTTNKKRKEHPEEQVQDKRDVPQPPSMKKTKTAASETAEEEDMFDI
jgi:hypothetical protein